MLKTKRFCAWDSPRIAGVIAGGINLREAKRAVLNGADTLELRIDTFKEKDLRKLAGSVRRLRSSGWAKNIPVIVTVRSKKEGARTAIGDKKRLEIFEELIPLSEMADIELGSGAILKDVVNFARRHKKGVIVSYHNFKSTPDARTLKEVIRKGRAAGGDIIKIATLVNGPEDIKRLAGTLLGSRDMIVIGMGAKGAATRVFFPMLGSLLTYGSVTGKTAPGQLSVKEIKKEFRRYGTPLI